jgi:L-ascorbate metabolism protein UlaG (beta-lactamase superfamily)
MRVFLIAVSLASGLVAATLATTDTIPARGGVISITPILHASVQIEYAGKVIQVDPWTLGDPALMKLADLILVTSCCDTHHLDVKAIQKLRKPGAPVIIPNVAQAKEKVPDGVMLPNGQETTTAGVRVESIASYDAYITGPPLHPKGEGNGYVITLGGKRIFFAGVTECAPEIQALKNIDVAFIPVNLPVGRMTPAKAADCVKGLRPQVVYPYHFDNARAQRMENPKAAATEADSAANRAGVEEFRKLLAGQGIDVRIGAFYPTISASVTR